jgi:hypothetical protein
MPVKLLSSIWKKKIPTMMFTSNPHHHHYTEEEVNGIARDSGWTNTYRLYAADLEDDVEDDESEEGGSSEQDTATPLHRLHRKLNACVMIDAPTMVVTKCNAWSEESEAWLERTVSSYKYQPSSNRNYRMFLSDVGLNIGLEVSSSMFKDDSAIAPGMALLMLLWICLFWNEFWFVNSWRGVQIVTPW